ncbi:hypothetical protein CHS0354_004763 [Potamilus streckersoni]|uniref:C2H2-type domain-containing protein n=1 Tax=Potamilus streckersoni TaxID=2493646 RepID=A0AAE0TCY4_9BIVA|nr:hypothetical protein CHS0354_004763 [Potamilus streckersoni]
MTELPPLSIVTTTKVQLMEFLPRLTQQVTRQDLLNRPEWWPGDIPWDNPTGIGAGEELLREVIRSCYQSPGKEKMLSGTNVPSDLVSKNGESSTSLESTSPNHGDVHSRAEYVPEEDSPVWVCFVCAKEFADQDRLMEHQDLCEQEEEKKNMASPPSPQPSYPRSAPSIPPPKSSDSLSLRPVTLHKVIRRQPKRKVLPDLYIPPPPDEYFQCLGLRPTPSLEDIKDAQKKEYDRDQEVIRVNVFETPGSPPLSQIISTTTSPRTPRSLMSQLSRDESSARKRHLSFSQSSTCLKEEDEEESQSDSDNSDERSEDSVEDTLTRRHYVKNSLLGIDICSPLGQRLKSNWDTENPFMMDNASIDQYCKDPDGEEKNIIMDKLRVRPTDYQVTFKFTKKYFQRYCHQYKFTHAERIEFLNVLKTGLSKHSRRILSCMKPCQVKLRRLSGREVKAWTTPKPKPVYRSLLTNHLAQNVQLAPGSYVQNMFLGSRSLAGLGPGGYRYSGPNPGFIGDQEGLIMNKVGYGPTPQLLVRTVSHSEGGQQGMRLEVLPIKNDQMHHLVSQNRVVVSSSDSGPKKDLSGSQKRKQSFAGVRDDDEISIISLSSDEEDDPKKTCHSACPKISGGHKIEMPGKKKIGPASFKRRISGQTQGIISPSIIRRNQSSPYPHAGSQRSTSSAGFRIVNGHLLNTSSQATSSLHGFGVGTQSATASDATNDNLCLKISNVCSLQGMTMMPSPHKERTSNTMQATNLQHATCTSQFNPRPVIDDVIVIDDD